MSPRVPAPAGASRPLPFLAALLALALAGTDPAGAHDSPDSQLATLDRRIEAEPESAPLRLERAELQRFRREWAAAAADLQAAGRLDPSMAAVDLAMARLLLDADNLPAALDAADRFLERSPRSVGGHLVRARVLRKSGRGLDAAEAFTRAIDLERSHRVHEASRPAGEPASGIQPDDYLQRASAQADAGLYDEAIAGLDEGLADLGQPVTLQLLAIDLESRRGRNDEALRRLAGIEARARRKETWIARRGDLLAAAGRREEAMAAWREAQSTIAALPPRLRDSAAITELQQGLRAKLQSSAPTAGEAAAPTTIALSSPQGERP